MSHLLAAALAATTTKPRGSGYVSLIFLLLIVGLFFFFFMRPQQRRRQQAINQVREGVAPGVEVQTYAGIIATVVSRQDDTVVLEIAPGVHVRFLLSAIGRVITPVEPSPQIDGPGEGGADGAAGDGPADPTR